jgi:hypothetical protein
MGYRFVQEFTREFLGQKRGETQAHRSETRAHGFGQAHRFGVSARAEDLS